MKQKLITALLLASLAALSSGSLSAQETASPVEPWGSPPFVRAPFEPHRILALLYAGERDSALTLVEAFENTITDDPFVLLIKAKVLRERLNDEDNDKERIRRGTAPIHELIDRAIDLCDEVLDRSDPDPRFYFYRGYGWMGKAQLHVLTRGYWSAGRAASRGKNDLERYLEAYPKDPDAQGMLGAYLYFADALPGLIKIVAKLLFIPSGDRDKGFELLRYGASHPGLFTNDYRMIFAAIEMVFEGKFEKGSAAFVELSREYPYYTRLIEPISVVSPLCPLKVREFDRIQETAITNHLSLDNQSTDWSLVKRMQLHRTFTNMYFGSPSDAIDEFTRLIDDPPSHPDWFLPVARLNRGYFHQKTGEKDKARADFELVRSSDDMKHYHDAAKTLIESLDGSVKTIHLDELEFIGLIYDGRIEGARESIQYYAKKYDDDALYNFYAGEIEVFEQDFAEAANSYQRALDCDETGGDQIYQTFAALRLAELYGQEGIFDKARDYLDRAKEYCHANYLLDFMIRSRKRYYHLLDTGKIDDRPTMLVRQRTDLGSD
ncbi:MAG: hypothetical protein JSW58_06535 [Candidatus Latescibacterota bacterium]|nr:MAG: hypothetical protein JSW58_06535 [Candidatus Latescibacterota bacterium]